MKGSVSLLALCIALPFPANAQVTEARDPLGIVTRFLSLLDSDEGAAGGMMASDFLAVAGDIGGHFSAAELKQVMQEIGRDCRLDRLAPEDRPRFEAGRTISVVVGHYRCVPSERQAGHGFDIDYFVEGQRIAGMYLHGGEAAP